MQPSFVVVVTPKPEKWPRRRSTRVSGRFPRKSDGIRRSLWPQPRRSRRRSRRRLGRSSTRLDRRHPYFGPLLSFCRFEALLLKYKNILKRFIRLPNHSRFIKRTCNCIMEENSTLHGQNVRSPYGRRKDDIRISGEITRRRGTAAGGEKTLT